MAKLRPLRNRKNEHPIWLTTYNRQDTVKDWAYLTSKSSFRRVSNCARGNCTNERIRTREKREKEKKARLIGNGATIFRGKKVFKTKKIRF